VTTQQVDTQQQQQQQQQLEQCIKEVEPERSAGEQRQTSSESRFEKGSEAAAVASAYPSGPRRSLPSSSSKKRDNCVLS
jgi:hypothetical protein